MIACATIESHKMVIRTGPSHCVKQPAVSSACRHQPRVGTHRPEPETRLRTEVLLHDQNLHHESSNDHLQPVHDDPRPLAQRGAALLLLLVRVRVDTHHRPVWVAHLKRRLTTPLGSSGRDGSGRLGRQRFAHPYEGVRHESTVRVQRRQPYIERPRHARCVVHLAVHEQRDLEPYARRAVRLDMSKRIEAARGAHQD